MIKAGLLHHLPPPPEEGQMGEMLCISNTKAGSKWTQAVASSSMQLQVVARPWDSTSTQKLRVPLCLCTGHAPTRSSMYNWEA